MEKNIKVLRQRKADAKKEAEGILAAAETREFTAEERTKLDSLKASLLVTESDIERVEAWMDTERNSLPAAGDAGRASAPEATKKPWGNFAEQLQAVRKAAISQGRDVDLRLFGAALGANEGVDAEGGFLVNPEYTSEILKRTYDTAVVAGRCTPMNMASSRLIMHAVDEDSRHDGSRWGGIQAYWTNEAGAYTGTKPKFREMQLVANKLTGLVYVTDEQAEDAPALMAYVNSAFPDEFAFKIDDAILNGTGAGQPLGILNSGAVLSIAKDSTNSGVNFVIADATNMYARMWGRSRANAVWLVNQDVESKLMGMALTVGSATALAASFVPPGVNGNQYGTLLGKPVIPVEQCATLGTAGDVILADLSQYLLARRAGMKADSSIHVAFLTGEQAFRFQLRLDGQPFWKKPLTPKNSTATLSPFITVQARS